MRTNFSAMADINLASSFTPSWPPFSFLSSRLSMDFWFSGAPAGLTWVVWTVVVCLAEPDVVLGVAVVMVLFSLKAAYKFSTSVSAVVALMVLWTVDVPPCDADGVLVELLLELGEGLEALVLLVEDFEVDDEMMVLPFLLPSSFSSDFWSMFWILSVVFKETVEVLEWEAW